MIIRQNKVGLSLIELLVTIVIISILNSLVILSFTGFSIHIQIANILDEYPINYKYFYFSRMNIFQIQALIAFYQIFISRIIQENRIVCSH